MKYSNFETKLADKITKERWFCMYLECVSAEKSSILSYKTSSTVTSHLYTSIPLSLRRQMRWNRTEGSRRKEIMQDDNLFIKIRKDTMG